MIPFTRSSPPRQFQSTLPQGERLGPCIHIPAADDFNPRSHKGSDAFTTPPDCCMNISIHAPTRGATPCWQHNYQHTLISIHAPTRGATSNPAVCLSRLLISIHAPTRGATSNPAGCLSRLLISIHAPTRGATKEFRAAVCEW